MAAKPTKSQITFNRQVLILPHSSVKTFPKRFDGRTINIDGYLIGLPCEFKYEGYIELDGTLNTPVYANTHLRLFTTNRPQYGVAWLDNETVVIADGEYLMYVNVTLPKPDVWWVVNSGVKHVMNNIGKRLHYTSVKLDDYLVVNDFVIKPTAQRRLTNDTVIEYDKLVQLTVLPEWTLSQIATAENYDYAEFVNDGKYHLMFTDQQKSYLLVHRGHPSDSYGLREMRFNSDLEADELNNAIKEQFPDLDFMAFMVDHDRRGNYYVLGMRCGVITAEAVDKFISRLNR